MARSHTPASRASTTPPRPSLDAPLDPEVAAGNRPLRWNDPLDVRAWLDRVRTQVADLAALGREGSRLHKHHILSRAERGRQVHAATTFLDALLGAAEAGLPTPSTDAAEEGAQGE